MALVLAFGLLGGCATPVGPVEVTRFNRAADGVTLGQGSVVVVGATDGEPQGLSLAPYVAAVSRELQRVGYTPVSGRGGYIAEVRVTRDRSVPARRSPVSVGAGGSTGSYGSGVGLGIGINLGGGPKPVIATTLSVRIRQVGPTDAPGDAVWEATAIDEARESAPAAQPGIAAARLAEAMFGGFPGRSGETIRVP